MLAPAGEWLRSVAERRLMMIIDDHDGIDHDYHDDHDDYENGLLFFFSPELLIRV